MEAILKDLDRTKELLETINTITRIFVDKPDDSGFNLVLDEIIKLLGAEYGVLGYLSKDKEYLNAAMSGNVWDACGVSKTGKLVFSKHNWKGVWAEIIYNGKTQIINNGTFSIPSGHVIIKNVMGVPIKRKDEIIGYIIVASNENEFVDDDLKLLLWISKWLSPVIYSRLRELEFQNQMSKIQVSILEMLNYANMYVLILDENMNIKFINYSLATDLGFADEIVPLGRCWLDFIPQEDSEMITTIHQSITTTNDKEKYKEVVGDIQKLNGEKFSVKWFNIRINHIYNWSFSFGMAQNKTLEITEESIRAYWEDKVLRDTTMIQSMRDVLTKQKEGVKIPSTCTPNFEEEKELV